MPKPYDVVTKRLIDLRPEDWLALVGLPADEAEPIDVEMMDTDLSTISSQSDRVLKVNVPTPRLHHLELESGHHGLQTPMNLLLYNVLLRRKYNLPVQSSVILLRRQSDSPALSGLLEYPNDNGDVGLLFRYGVLRVWQLSAETLLAGGIGTLPLVPLSNVTQDELPRVIQRMKTRIEEEVSPTEDRELWTAIQVLMGLRFSEGLIHQLLQGVRHMKESVTYQAILREGLNQGLNQGLSQGLSQGLILGRTEEARAAILRIGRKRLGEALPNTVSAIESIDSLDVLERLQERLLDVANWEDLLAS